MTSEVEATATKICKSLHNEHEWRAKYLNEGMNHKYSLKLSWIGTTLVVLAEDKLILPLLTMNQSKLCKENGKSPWIVLF